MDTATRMLQITLGILIGIIALFSGGIFLGEINLFRLGLSFNLPFLLIAIAYFILVLGLVRLKKWALTIFGIIFGLSLAIVVILALKGEPEQSLAEGFYFSISGLSILILLIATLLAVVRRIVKWLKP